MKEKEFKGNKGISPELSLWNRPPLATVMLCLQEESSWELGPGWKTLMTASRLPS